MAEIHTRTMIKTSYVVSGTIATALLFSLPHFFGVSRLATSAVAQERGIGTQGIQNQPQVTSEFVIQGLKAREEAIQSLELCWASLVYTHNSPVLKRANDYYAATDPAAKIANEAMALPPRMWKHLWVADGSKGRSEVRPGVGLPQGSSASISAYDGEKLQHWDIGANAATEDVSLGRWESGGSARSQVALGPNPYKLNQVLSDRKAAVVGWEKIGGVEAIKMSASSGGTKSYWWIAPSLDCMLVRYETGAQTTVDGPLASWRYLTMVEEATEVAGFWVPTVVRTLKLSGVRKAGSQEVDEVWEVVQRHITLRVEVNKPISPKNFEILLPPNTQIERDPALGANYEIEGKPEEFQEKLKQAQLKGEQPDIEACDFSALEAEVKTGKIDPKYFSDQVERIALETQAEPAAQAK